MDAEPEAHSPSAVASESGSNCEFFMDAESGEGDYFLDGHKEDEDDIEQGPYSIINEIRNELETAGDIDKSNDSSALSNRGALPKSQSLGVVAGDNTTSNGNNKLSNSADSLQNSMNSGGSTTDSVINSEVTDPENYLENPVWRQKRKHIFVLSSAGKPIYSLHGPEQKLATLCGIVQALVSVVQLGQDAITSIHANGIKFVFLVRNSLILVGVWRTNMSVQQMQQQLSDVYNQILFTLTHSYVNKIFEHRKNYDLRCELQHSDLSLIHHLLRNDSCESRVTNNVFTFLTNSIRVMPLPTAIRSNIVSAIQSNCSKIKNLVFAVLIGDNKLISLVRMKKYSIHPSDLRLLFNLVECSKSINTFANWRPICLPKFDMNGFLFTHISHLAEDCQACLLLLSVDRDEQSFFTLSEAKGRISDKLRRSNCLQAIRDEMNKSKSINLQTIGVPELRHFLYKPRAMAQVLCTEIAIPYNTLPEFERLQAIYCDLLHRIHNGNRPLKLIYEIKDREVALAWITSTYELYAIFEPMMDKTTVIKYVDKLIKWIDKEYDVYFIRNHPNF